MPTYVAFLRAINLGARRRFPKAAIVEATEAAGGEEVATHINTGNVRVRLALRSRAKVEAALERAYLDHARFEVPTIVFTREELTALVEDAERLGDSGAQYVSLLKAEPTKAAIEQALARAEEVAVEGERLVVRGRGAHLVLDRPDRYHEAKLSNAFVEKHLGTATSRNLTVLRTIVEKWC